MLRFWWPSVVPRPHVGGTVVIWPKPLYWRWSCLFQTHPSWWLSPPAVDSNASLSSWLESLPWSSQNFLCCYFTACCQVMWRVIYYLPLTGFNLVLGQLNGKRQNKAKKKKRKERKRVTKHINSLFLTILFVQWRCFYRAWLWLTVKILRSRNYFGFLGARADTASGGVRLKLTGAPRNSKREVA